MAPMLRDKTGTVFASACCVTALLNSVSYTAHAQPRILPVQPTAPQAEENILRYGDFDVRPTAKAGVMYDDNIFLESSGEEDDILWVITPGVLLGSGDYQAMQENFILVTYEPDFIIFTDNSDENAIDHDAQFLIQRRPGKWRLNLGQTFQKFTGADVDLGERADETVFVTRAGAEYELSPKTSFELGAMQRFDDFKGSGLDGYNQWEGQGWFDYWLTPKVRVGAGLTGGYVDVKGAANQTYEQPLLRVRYTLTDKVDLHASGGIEFRQFDGDGDDHEEPVGSLGVTYKPFENTRLGLDAYHRSQNSVRLNGQNYRATGARAAINHDLFVKYHLFLAGGYEFLNYYSTEEGVLAPREDDYLFLRTAASWDVTERMNLGIFYQFQDDDSNDSNFSWTDNQVGLTFAFRF